MPFSPLGVVVLGSTGSIGRQTLDVIRRLPGRFAVVGLAGGHNTTELARQVGEFRPRYAWAAGRSLELDQALEASETRWVPMEEMATAEGAGLVMVGTAGAAGLAPTLAALRAGLPVAIANKEVLVMAGHLVRQAVREEGQLRPIDSEHSAIWQCLWGEGDHTIRRIILTASGGAFRELDRAALAAVTPAQALQHPTWNMGPKITVDSATLMNKGMETIEARWLFGVEMDQVEVLMHRESIVHSLVEFSDGSVKAQLGVPDMRLPIQCALAYPERLPEPAAPVLDLAAVGSLTFASPETERFPCLGLAMEAGRRAGTYPAAMAAADEVAVERFLAGEIGFLDIPRLIEAVLEGHSSVPDPSLEAVLDADRSARRDAAATPVGVGV